MQQILLTLYLHKLACTIKYGASNTAVLCALVQLHILTQGLKHIPAYTDDILGRGQGNCFIRFPVHHRCKDQFRVYNSLEMHIFVKGN